MIGIIALLIGILLPALGKARRTAQNIKCQSNIKQILYAMRIYASENKDSICGSPWTSSRTVYADPMSDTFATANGFSGYSSISYPSVITACDWMTPVTNIINSKQLRVANTSGTMSPPLIDDATTAGVAARFQLMRDSGVFKCPNNDLVATPKSGGVQFSPGPAPSYMAAFGFLIEHSDAAAKGKSYTTDYPNEYEVPPTYNVTVAKVGNAAEKIYIGDGSNGVSNASTSTPAIKLVLELSTGAFSDIGACFTGSYSWVRNDATNSGTTKLTGFEPRLFSYRHGVTTPGGSTDSYKGNFGFFDGHVESLGDLKSTNPTYWFPRGTKITFVAKYTTLWADTVQQFNPSGASHLRRALSSTPLVER